jgi:hypothetical protein
MKKAIGLQKNLEPSAIVHQTRNLDALRSLALEVQGLFQSLPQALLEVKVDLQLAIKGIVTGRQPPKKTKPDLCIEDDLAFDL